jgi:hypothetical protein
MIHVKFNNLLILSTCYQIWVTNTPHALNFMHINNNSIIIQNKKTMQQICNGEKARFFGYY